jgi:hypothetical protein
VPEGDFNNRGEGKKMISKKQVQLIIEKEDEGPTLDYKEDLNLQTDGDKAQFVKDVLSLANSGQTAHIIIGVEDGTRKLVGIKTKHKAEQLNDILKGKCDPPLTVEYAEKTILGNEVGIVEFIGDNPPYIVSVTDQFGGIPTSNPQKSFYICRGTVFVRCFNKNEGTSRADLDKMYKVKYVTLQADLELSHEISINHIGELKEVQIKFFLKNLGEVIATDIYIFIQFKNIKEIVICSDPWKNISQLNNNIPTINTTLPIPIVRPIRSNCHGLTVKVGNDIEQIEAKVIIGATNMRTKEGPYTISLKGA